LTIDSTEKDVKCSPKRPKFVWAITILYLSYLCLAILMLSLMYSDTVFYAYFGKQRLSFSSLTLMEILIATIIDALILAGVYCLFMLKRHAIHAFIYAFIISTFRTAYVTFSKYPIEGIESVSLGGSIFWVINITISIAIILYANSLLKKGILR